MRKLLFLLFALITTAGLTMAQEPAKLVKAGSKALAKYVSDNSNSSALSEAQSAADKATTADASLGSAWLLKGNAYAAEVNQLAATVNKQNAEAAAAKLADPSAADPDFSGLTLPNDEAKTAIMSFKKAYETAAKASGKKKAVTGLTKINASLSSLGNAMLSSGRYDDSYGPLVQMVEIDEYLKANGETALFATEDALDQHNYIIAVVARQKGDTEMAMKLHKQLYDKSYEEAAVYAGYSQLLMDAGDEEGGLEALTKGRNMFPENSDILFAEINYYIKKQDFNTLEEKLQAAIAKEPNNVGLYNALGNVYMNLSQSDGQDDAQSSTYMEKSISYFQEAISRDANNVDATYSIGSLYFNKAVAKSNEMNKLGTSKADQKKYDELNLEINELFEQALPFFVKAEKIDPNDRNTLIALKEIYARQNNFEQSKIYKERLESMGG